MTYENQELPSVEECRDRYLAASEEEAAAERVLRAALSRLENAKQMHVATRNTYLLRKNLEQTGQRTPELPADAD